MEVLQPVSGALRHLFRLWLDALQYVLPANLNRRLAFVDTPIDINIASIVDVERKLNELPQNKNIRWVLDEKIVLRHTFGIPRTASNDASKVVELEVQRIMPLPADQLIHAFRLEKKQVSESVTVHLYAARKSVTDAIFKMSDRQGSLIHSVEVSTNNGLVSVPFAFKSISRRKYARSLTLVASVIVLILTLSTIPQIYQMRLNDEINSIDLRVSETRRQTESIAGLQRQMRVMQTLYQSVQKEKRDIAVLDLFGELTKASPDGVVFEEMRLDGRRLFVTGVAVAPENWVLDLERNPSFENVNLSSVIGLDDSLSKRFEVRFDVIPPHERVSE